VGQTFHTFARAVRPARVLSATRWTPRCRAAKPSNIVVTPDWQAKSLDFGLALHPQRRVTVPGTIPGTVGSVAPEQARDPQTVDARADLFGLGATMYWALTGREPFANTGDPIHDLHQRLTAPPPDIRRFRPELPEDLGDLIGRMLSTDPDRRPPSGRVVAISLSGLARWAAYLGDEFAVEEAGDGEALQSRRSYRPALPHARVLRMVVNCGDGRCPVREGLQDDAGLKSRGFEIAGEVNGEGRAVAGFARGFGVAAALPGEPGDGRQLQAHAGQKIRLEGVGQKVRREARPGVRDAQPHEFAGSDVAGGDRQRAAGRQRVQGSRHQVRQRLLDLPGVGTNGPESGGQVGPESHARREQRPQSRLGVGHDPAEVEHAGREHLPAAKGEELPGQVGRPFAGLENLRGVRPQRVARGEVLEQHVAVAVDDGEQVVQVVGDAPGQPGQGGQRRRPAGRRPTATGRGRPLGFAAGVRPLVVENSHEVSGSAWPGGDSLAPTSCPVAPPS
jgi:hypothetical protein